MDENVSAPSTTPPAPPKAIAADKLAAEYRWPGRLGTFDGWARFAVSAVPPEPPAMSRAR
jgi:hypothetical protein